MLLSDSVKAKIAIRESLYYYLTIKNSLCVHSNCFINLFIFVNRNVKYIKKDFIYENISVYKPRPGHHLKNQFYR